MRFGAIWCDLVLGAIWCSLHAGLARHLFVWSWLAAGFNRGIVAWDRERVGQNAAGHHCCQAGACPHSAKPVITQWHGHHCGLMAVARAVVLARHVVCLLGGVQVVLDVGMWGAVLVVADRRHVHNRHIHNIWACLSPCSAQTEPCAAEKRD